MTVRRIWGQKDAELTSDPRRFVQCSQHHYRPEPVFGYPPANRLNTGIGASFIATLTAAHGQVGT